MDIPPYRLKIIHTYYYMKSHNIVDLFEFFCSAGVQQESSNLVPRVNYYSMLLPLRSIKTIKNLLQKGTIVHYYQ